MFNRFILLCLLTFMIPFFCNAQTQLNHEKKVYISPEGKIYVNKQSPIYFRVATSPDDNAPSYLLHSEDSKKYSNPMYFDTEGKNTLHSPSAVDTTTKKVVQPLRDVLFEVYADGIAPVTSGTIASDGRIIRNGITYLGKNTKIQIKPNDAVSGVENSYISSDMGAYQAVSDQNTSFDSEKEYSIKFYSTDRVGNVEVPKSLSFRIDLSAPNTTLNIVGDNKGKVLSSKAALSLTSKDTLSGVSRILYSVNEGAEKVYTAPIPLSVFKDGETRITYYAVDNVGNKEAPKVISTSTEKPAEKEEASTFSFYIDKESPNVSFEIVGDQFKGKSLFISERSKFQINATDEKSGVEKVTYSQNNPLPTHVYSEPFSIQGEGMQSVSYAASDYVGNIALAKTQQVFVDKTNPKSALSFSGKQFYNRDTLFITKETKLVINSAELGSGVQKITFSLDGSAKQDYLQPVNIGTDGFHVFEYRAIDNVNNSEEVKSKSFIVDNIAPEIHYNFSVKAIGEKSVRDENYTIYPSNVMLYIAATDNASGVERIEYKINGKPVQSVIPVKGFVPGNYDIEISAFDVLKNKTTQTVRFSIEN